MTRDQDFFSSMERHALFDPLRGVHEADRSPADVMRMEVFDLLDARLQGLANIADHASIHFAHAASTEGRQVWGLDAWWLERSKEALRSLTETAELVGRWFLISGVGDILPVPQYDQFAFIDQTLANAEAIKMLRDAWHAFGRETSQWHMVDAAASWA